VKVVRVRMDRMSVGQQPAGGPTGSRRPLKTPPVNQATSDEPPPLPPPRGLRQMTKTLSLPPRSTTASQLDTPVKPRSMSTASPHQVRWN